MDGHFRNSDPKTLREAYWTIRLILKLETTTLNYKFEGNRDFRKKMKTKIINQEPVLYLALST